MIETQRRNESFRVARPQELKRESFAQSKLQRGRDLSNMQPGIDLTSFSSSRRCLRVRLTDALLKHVVLRVVVPTTILEGLPDLLAAVTAVILVDVTVVTRTAALVTCRRPLVVRDDRDLPHLQRRCGDIAQAISYSAPNRCPTWTQPRLVNVVHHMHDVHLLRVDQVQVQERTRCLEKSDTKGDIQVLSVLVLVDRHLILGLQLKEILQFHDEQDNHDRDGADGQITPACGFDLKLLHRLPESIERLHGSTPHSGPTLGGRL
mmetsp:Transcript_61172/g.162553  ORF Transcript_61172/g.162553 Transcript_61172/m.162553 type:complete len:263 (-) Transcript_61172:48-836(-)